MKTFKDLVFRQEKLFEDKQKEYSKMFFKNGYGVSVIKGYGAYGNKNNPYELAVIQGSENEFYLHYDNTVSNGDVVGWLNEQSVTELMIKVQEFKKI